VHDDIGAERERTAEIGRRKRIIDEKRNTGRVRDFRDLRYVEDFQAGIADGLGDDEPRAFADRRTQA
jgi:hypothetical protein